MGPSRKPKHNAHPKRSCPCCAAKLSEKTIEQHLSGTHIPTHIKVTLAEAAQKRMWLSGNFSGDLLGDISDDPNGNDLDFLHSDLESTYSDVLLEQEHPDPDLQDPLPDIHPACANTEADADLEDLEETVRNTWKWARVDDYESDEEDDGIEDAPQPQPQTSMGNSDSDPESEFEWEGMEIPHGLGMDDLVDEELQCIIAEFGELFFSFMSITIAKITIQLRNSLRGPRHAAHVLLEG